MLDYFCIFSKGGAILWTFQLAALKGNPIQALIQTCLLEDRSAEKSFSYTPKDGAPYTLKWRLNNELGLVFVAVYQRALSLTYVDELLDNVVNRFIKDGFYEGHKYDYAPFNDTFRRLLLECENRAVDSKNVLRPAKVKGSGTKQGGGKGGSQKGRDEEDEEDDSGKAPREEPEGASPQESDGAEEEAAEGEPGAEEETMEEKLKKLKLGRRGGRGAKGAAPGNKAEEKEEKEEKKKPKKKANRNWNNIYGNEEEQEPQKLDFCDSPTKGEKVEQQQVPSGPSGMDVESEVRELEVDEEDMDGDGDGSGAKGGFLSSMVRNLKVSVMGGEALTRSDIEPAMEALKKKLMERNVGHEIVNGIADSVAASLEGKKLASFTRISKVVYSSVEESLTRILTPPRSIDILREVQANKAKPGNRPYVITFVGVNGVGKSTNLSKVAYWLIQHDIKVMIAACDTFRSGAVEQLRTHCQRLGVSLYERGYEKDPAKVAFEGIKQAERERADVLLVDTAGRMQDNEPLMRALASLISLNRPDLVLFVGEALVGNDALDQISKFNQRLTDLANAKDDRTRAIDGIVLTKFDTIDDKVGAAISMVYTSSAPIMFVGCGQTYIDLKRLNVKEVVNSLLS